MYTHIIFKALRAVRRARCPNLQFSVRVPNEVTFRSTFGVICYTLGVICKVISGPWDTLGAPWAHFSCQKKAWEPQVPQEPPKRRHPLFGGNLLEALF